MFYHVSISLFLPAESYSTVHIYQILFIHSSTEGHLDTSTFWLLWITLLQTWVYKHFFEFLHLILLGINSGVEWLDCVICVHVRVRVCVFVCLVMSSSLWPHGLKPHLAPLSPEFFQARILGSYHFLLQGIFPRIKSTPLACPALAGGFHPWVRKIPWRREGLLHHLGSRLYDNSTEFNLK